MKEMETMSLKTFFRKLFLKTQSVKILIDEGKLEEAKKQIEEMLKLLS